ncbi:ABC transporter permease [Reyranella soli]|uniref:ABC transporter permease n=1 Tax=Reyranella soli TaxID=1230389 RepID=A0A512NPB2_9HYPH|nr:ABC transporter permease [Reyranella soli]GEP60795.1 ABC transporter permease [Reyranella soli]
MRRTNIWIGGALLAVMGAIALLSPYLAQADPRALSPASRLLPPSATHWFGTDQLGRDLFARVLWGARVSLLVGVSVAILSALVGTAVGMLSASSRGLDAVVMRVMDGVMSIPAILLAIALMAVAGASVVNVIAAVTLVEIPRVARLVRGVLLSLREQPYVEAAVTVGTSQPMIMIRHMLPGVVPPLIVQATFIWATAMILEAALSFIGAGTPPSTPSWGNLLADARALWQIRPTLVFFPAVFLFVTLLSVNMLGDGLRDILDPRQRPEG